MLYSRDIPVRHSVDVFVAGGGPAGVAAAVTCARKGKRVFLAEAMGAFGGMGTLGLVPQLMPLTDGIHFLADGIGREVRDAVSPLRDNSWCVYPLRLEPLKRLYDDMVVGAGVHFSFFTTLIDVIKDGSGRVSKAILTAKSGLFAVEAKVFIDCTGDGDLAVMAGAPFEMGDEHGNTMPPTLCSLWANVDCKNMTYPNGELEKAIGDGVFTYHDRHLPGIYEVDPEHGLAGGNIGHCFGTDATDEASLTRAMLWGRKSVLEYERFYKEYLKGYENMVLCATGDLLGVRESRRITGDYVLNLGDFHSRAVFSDEIGRYAYPVDIHIMTPDDEAYEKFNSEFETLRYGVGESYGIPYRSLTPKGLRNVLVAGRCVSTDRYMEASIRVMGGCYITGQACGAAAALAAESGDVRDFDVKELQRSLLRSGAYLPNYAE